MRKGITKKLKKIQETFFYELSSVGFSFDGFSGASFITSALDMFEDICSIIIEMYHLKFSKPEDVLAFIYSTKKVKSDYSELYSQLREWEDCIDYGELSLAEDEIDIEGFSSEMESMIQELIELAKNE